MVTKRLVDIDDALLSEAQHSLRITSVSDTVHAALRQVVDAAARSRQVEWLRDGGLEELAEPEARAAVWH